jgi:hypothetical protein
MQIGVNRSSTHNDGICQRQSWRAICSKSCTSWGDKPFIDASSECENRIR